MRYFVIHSNRDWDKILPILKDCVEDCNAKFISLNGNQTFWKRDAFAKIRQSDKIIYMVGQVSAKSPYIRQELKIALKEKKLIYVCRLSQDCDAGEIINTYLTSKNISEGNIEGEKIIQKDVNLVTEIKKEELKDVIKKDSFEILQDLKAIDFSNKETLFKQYKIYTQTSEDVVKRKQYVNNFYITLNSILLGAIVSIISVSAKLPLIFDKLIISFPIAFAMGIIGIIISWSWVSLLQSYADLNQSKIQIIRCIEEYLALNLYDTEWIMLTKSIGEKKYRSFSGKEKRIAKLFMVLYIILCCVSITLAIITSTLG